MEISNKSKSVALIGLGYWGKNILRNLEQLMQNGIIVIKYLCDTFEGSLKHYKNKFICVTDYNIILNDSEISCIFVITPIQTHYKIIMDFINAGKNVYVEKPICMNKHELDNIRNKNMENNTFVYCDYTFVHSDKINNLKSKLMEYDLESIIHIDIHRMSFGKTVHTGVIYDLLPHDVSIISKLFDLMSDQIKIIDVYKIYNNDLFFKALLILEIQLSISNKIKVFIKLSSINENKIRCMKIYLKDKIIEYDDTSDLIKIFYYNLTKNTTTGMITEERKNIDEIININYEEPLMKSIKTFLNIKSQNDISYIENWKMNEIIINLLEKSL